MCSENPCGRDKIEGFVSYGPKTPEQGLASKLWMKSTNTPACE